MTGPLIDPLEPRRLFAGVTLITHGFNGSAGDWVTRMGNAVASFGGALASQPRYLMTVTDPAPAGGALSVAYMRLGAAPASWANADIVVLLDWSSVAGLSPSRNTYDVGAAVADKLLAANSIPDLVAPLAELPLHLLGHSRGASAVSEIARGLGQRGVWVDQLTFFDPHPVDNVREPIFTPNLGDAPMRVFENVLFADNYWRTDGTDSFDVTGESVNGAYNLQLTESVMSGSDNGYSGEHSDTHLWYHGTIGRASGTPPFQDSDGSEDIGGNWYSAPHPARDTTGFLYSRIGNGIRPAAGSKSSGAVRDALALTASGANVWDNIAIGGLTSDFTVAQGTPIALSAAFEDRAVGGVRDATITLGFDRDDNPYNGVFNTAVSALTSSLPTDTLDAVVPTTGIAGTFRVYAKITNGTHTRYHYAPARATITVPGYDRTWTGGAAGNWSVASNWTPAGRAGASDRVAIVDAHVSLAAGAAAAKVAGLLVAGDASLDLHDGDLVIDYSANVTGPLGTWDGVTYTGVHGLIKSGRLFSSSAIGTLTTLGAAEASEALNLSAGATAVWSNQNVDATSTLIKFTYAGDAALDGRINIDDYGQIDFNVASSGSVYGSFHGDFNLDGKINIDDYGVIDFNVGAQADLL